VHSAAWISALSTPSADGLEAQAARQLDRPAHDLHVVLLAGHAHHEGAVDLHPVERQPAQVAERRVAGAEVIE